MLIRKKIIKKVLVSVAEKNVNSACGFILYQEVVPEEAVKLKRKSKKWKK